MSYAVWRVGLGGGSNKEAIRIGRLRSISGTGPATIAINGTVGGPLIDALAKAHGSSQHVKAHPSKAMPMGPVTAHMSNVATTSPLRHDIMFDVITRTESEVEAGRAITFVSEPSP